MTKRKAPVSRRDFIKKSSLAIGATAAIGCSSTTTGADPDTTSPDTAPPPDSKPTDITADDAADTGTPPPQAAATVSVVWNANVLEAVRQAVELAGGLEAIQPGQTVFIKPNAVHSFGVGVPGVVTSNEVIAAVITLVKERDAGHIVVGDRSARFFESEDVLKTTGMVQAALEAGADEVYAAPKPVDAPDDWVLVQPAAFEETWKAEGGIQAMKRIIEADHFINLPVCKNHRWAGNSLAMKNLVGAIGDDSRNALHYNEGEPDRLSRDIAILNQAFSPLMSIIDARGCVINGGPEGILDDAVVTEPGLIMASTDRLALDAMGISLIQLELTRNEIFKPDPTHALITSTPAWQMPQIVHGIERSLGVASSVEVELKMQEVPDAEALEQLFRT